MEYGYLIGSVFVATAWFLIYATSPHLRRQMITMGLLLVPVALYMPFFVSEYWNPPSLFNLADRIGITIEDVIFMFFGSGVAAVLYEFVARQRTVHEGNREPSAQKFFIAFLYGASLFLILNLLGLAVHLYSSLLFNIVAILIIWLRRKDLIIPMISSGIFMGMLYFVSLAIFDLIFPEFFATYYNIENLWGIYILDVPLEEIIFGFHFGVLLGGLYEYLSKSRFVAHQ